MFIFYHKKQDTYQLTQSYSSSNVNTNYLNNFDGSDVISSNQLLDLADLAGHLSDAVHGDGEALDEVGLDLDVAQHEGLVEPHGAERVLGTEQHPI